MPVWTCACRVSSASPMTHRSMFFCLCLPSLPPIACVQDRTGIISTTCSVSGSSVKATFERTMAVADYPIAASAATDVAWAVGSDMTSFSKHKKSQVMGLATACRVVCVLGAPLSLSAGLSCYVGGRVCTTQRCARLRHGGLPH